MAIHLQAKSLAELKTTYDHNVNAFQVSNFPGLRIYGFSESHWRSSMKTAITYVRAVENSRQIVRPNFQCQRAGPSNLLSQNKVVRGRTCPTWGTSVLGQMQVGNISWAAFLVHIGEISWTRSGRMDVSLPTAAMHVLWMLQGILDDCILLELTLRHA